MVLLELEFGLSFDAMLEIFRRENVFNFIDYLKTHTDEELRELFDRYTYASLAHQHYLTLWFYELTKQVIDPDVISEHQDLLYREFLRWMDRRGVINELEIIKLMQIQPWLQVDAVTFINGLNTAQTMTEFYGELNIRKQNLAI
jgi:hypothetical protein